MKKIRVWAVVISFTIFLIAWAVMGLKIYDGDYNITIEAYTGLICWGVILICAVSRIFTDKCPHCGKLRVTNGRYCPYCGKEIA